MSTTNAISKPSPNTETNDFTLSLSLSCSNSYRSRRFFCRRSAWYSQLVPRVVNLEQHIAQFYVLSMSHSISNKYVPVCHLQPWPKHLTSESTTSHSQQCWASQEQLKLHVCHGEYTFSKQSGYLSLPVRDPKVNLLSGAADAGSYLLLRGYVFNYVNLFTGRVVLVRLFVISQNKWRVCFFRV